MHRTFAKNSAVAKVVVGLSGGVDSSVAAHLLQQQGHEVIGLFMKNWHDDSVTISDECPWLDDSNDAMLVADKLGIPFQTVDLSETYRERIVDYMFDEYEKGRTPNPDVLCNREIKFDVFLDIAMSLGADYVATGHYCQKGELEIDGKTTYQLLAGADPNKDQSYFLCQVSQEQLAKTLFPIGHLQKSEVRRIAEEQELVTAGKKDSQGLCFIGKVRLPDFLQQKLAAKKGDIVEIPEAVSRDQQTTISKISGLEREELISLSRKRTYSPTDGKTVGTHDGAHFFTRGQRKGLGVGGTKEPLFVIATDVESNTVYVGQGKAHSGLKRQGLFISHADMHWIRPDKEVAEGEVLKVMARIRYRQPLEAAMLYNTKDGYFLIFKNAQMAIAAGQFAAWYEGDECLGSGTIS